MVEINPVIPVHPVSKPMPIRDEHNDGKHKRHQDERQTDPESDRTSGPEPQHIDEIV